MKLTYGELVEEIQERPSDELYDIAEIAKQYAIERRREEILRNAEESRREYLEGKLGETDG